MAALAGLFAGETIVLLPAFDAREIWRAVERHQVNVLVIIGDAMARPLVEAYLAGGYDKTLSLSGAEPPNRVVIVESANMDAVKAWRDEGLLLLQ